MARYAAFLRGVSPMNASMPKLKAAFERGGFGDVRTLLSSGNVVFSTRAASIATLEQRAEQAMEDGMGRSFATIIRPISLLEALIAADPFAAFDLADDSKRVVTFFKQPLARPPKLPVSFDGAIIHRADTGEAYSSYVRSANGPAFMTLIERTFGKEVTTRTWDTVLKCTGA